MIHGKVTCPKCSTHFEIQLHGAPQQQSEREEKPARKEAGNSLGELLAACDGQPMTDWEEKFVTDLQGKFDKYGAKTFLSDKQNNMLRKIANGEGGRSREDEF